MLLRRLNVSENARANPLTRELIANAISHEVVATDHPPDAGAIFGSHQDLQLLDLNELSSSLQLPEDYIFPESLSTFDYPADSLYSCTSNKVEDPATLLDTSDLQQDFNISPISGTQSLGEFVSPFEWIGSGCVSDNCVESGQATINKGAAELLGTPEESPICYSGLTPGVANELYVSVFFVLVTTN